MDQPRPRGWNPVRWGTILRILALDLSKWSTGWAYYDEGSERPFFGVWNKLASEFTECDGRIWYKLYETLVEHRKVMPFDRIYGEQAVNALPQGVPTNIDSIELALGLKTTVELYAFSEGLKKPEWVHMATWRKHFFGKMPRAKRGEPRPNLKAMAIQQCHRMDINVLKHDEAEAIGVLDYACDVEGIRAPWRHPEELRLVAGGNG